MSAPHTPTPANGKPRRDGVSPDQQERKAWAQMRVYAQLAFVFPVATVVGWLIGVGFDRWLHTTWLYIVGLIVGIVAGFVEMVRTAMKNQ